MTLNRSPEFKVVIVQIVLVATLFFGQEAKQYSFEFKRNWPRGIGGVGVLRFFLFLALAAILLTGAEPFKVF